MSRVQIELPQKFDFSTEFQVCIDDVYPGGHLRNYTLISILNEAHMRFMKDKGFPELEIDGLYFINTDLEVKYESQAFHGDALVVEVAAANLHKYGCDLIYRVINKATGELIAAAKTGQVFFDYKHKKIAEIPEKFRGIFS
jgi:4-hydroxybenzoyl-CoA thioesterase